MLQRALGFLRFLYYDYKTPKNQFTPNAVPHLLRAFTLSCLKIMLNRKLIVDQLYYLTQTCLVLVLLL